MDNLIDYYYLGVNILVFISSLKRIIVLSYELFYPYFEEYFRLKRLKKVIHFYDEDY